MHILQFSFGGTPIPAIHGGAVQQTIEELSLEFTQRGHKVTVITDVDIKEKKAIEELNKQGVNYQYLFYKKGDKASLIISIFRLIIMIIKNGHYDIVHIHVPIWIHLFMFLSFFIGKPKIIWHVHNRSRFSFLAKSKKIEIVGISKSVIEGINRSIEESNISIIPNICRHKKFPLLEKEDRRKIRKHYNISDDDFVIGFAGRIAPEKGLHVLLDALKDLEVQNIDNFHLLVAGSSWFKHAKKSDYENQVINKSKNLKVSWLGYVDNWDLYKLYNSCDVFVVPSTWEEPAGQVVLEAQACGTKVLASNIGGIPEFLSPYESTFEPKNNQELSSMLKKFIFDDTESNETLHMRSEWVQEKFNLNVIADQWIRLYNK